MPGPPSIPDLVYPEDLKSRRGGPFPPDEVESAGAAVRGECGWHVAPRLKAHRVLVSGTSWTRLVLPSRLVHEVLEVRDVVTGLVLDGWRLGASNSLIRAAGWPRGEDNLEVVLDHGHPQCPPDLLAVVAERTRLLVSAPVPGTRSSTKTVGEVTRSTSSTDSSAARSPAWTEAADAVLDRYRV